jgi:site-specific DNA recombinase
MHGYFRNIDFLSLQEEIDMKVIIYPRVSSKKQAQHGDSIEAQEFRLRQFCEQNGHEIVDVYTDAGKSASICDDNISVDLRNGKFIVGIDLRKRPAFHKLIEESMSKKFEGIVFFKWDRFSRNNLVSKLAQIYFGRRGIALIPSDDAIDPLMVEIKGALGEEEIRKMKERVRQTRMLRFEKGIMVGRAPIGYRFNKINKTMEIDKRKAAVVKGVFQAVLDGKKYAEICDTFNIKPQSFYNIIRNDVYIGVLRFEGINKKGLHEPIVSKETFYKVQDILKGNGKEKT